MLDLHTKFCRDIFISSVTEERTCVNQYNQYTRPPPPSQPPPPPLPLFQSGGYIAIPACVWRGFSWVLGTITVCSEIIHTGYLTFWFFLQHVASSSVCTAICHSVQRNGKKKIDANTGAGRVRNVLKYTDVVSRDNIVATIEVTNN